MTKFLCYQFPVSSKEAKKTSSAFKDSNLSLLSKSFPLLALDKIVKSDENEINLRTYDSTENLV